MVDFLETFPDTRRATKKLARAAADLRPVEANNCHVGLLRSRTGETDRNVLNRLRPHARIGLFYDSPFFAEMLLWFIGQSQRHLGPDFHTQGYAGLIKAGGTSGWLHRDRRLDDAEIVKRMTMVLSPWDENASTMHYVGADGEKHDEKPMEFLVRTLGHEAFVQANHGQIGIFGPDQWHGEPPLAVGTPRLFLASTKISFD